MHFSYCILIRIEQNIFSWIVFAFIYCLKIYLSCHSGFGSPFQESEINKIQAPLYILPLLIKTIALMNFRQSI